jgi:transposase
MLFGKKTEKQTKSKKRENNKKNSKKRGAKSGHKGRGRKIPKDLPKREEKIDIPDDEKFCPKCGLPYEDLGSEECSHEVGVEKEYYIKVYRRKKYKKTCSCPKQIVTAPVPKKLIPKGKFNRSFWINVLIDKYKNHMPIERQIKDMQEYGLPEGSPTVFGGIKTIYSSFLSPLYEAMIRSSRDSEHVHIDESGWKLFHRPGGKKNSNGFIWVFVCRDTGLVLYVIRPGRGATVPCETLFGMDIEEASLLEGAPTGRKRITVDKYSAYKRLERYGFVELTYCWAHQRREFRDAGIKYPELTEWADQWVERIGRLYHLNNQRVRREQGTADFEKYNAKLREKIGEVRALTHQKYDHQGQKAVIDSMKNHWAGLTVFIDNPVVDMDNNISERMLRGPVLGRKNYYGTRCRWSSQLSAAMFSIVQTCQISDISPRAYLDYYFSECEKRGAAPDETEIESFLPHKLSDEAGEKLRVAGRTDPAGSEEEPAPDSAACPASARSPGVRQAA